VRHVGGKCHRDHSKSNDTVSNTDPKLKPKVDRMTKVVGLAVSIDIPLSKAEGCGISGGIERIWLQMDNLKRLAAKR
jgi:hypothetical protein